MIAVKEYNSDNFSELEEFCKTEYLKNSSHSAAKNMWDADWETKEHTLLYQVSKTKMYSDNNGMLSLLYDNDRLIGCGGVYVSEFSSDVALAGVRTWVTRQYRNNMYIRCCILPVHRKWAIDHRLSVIAVSFNEYNKNLIKLFFQNRYKQVQTEDHMFFNNHCVLDYRVNIKNTPQWVIYEKLSDSSFNWEQIKC